MSASTPGMESVCAHRPDGKPCPREAKFACTGCFLVQYSGPICQKNHWIEHKKDCKSLYMKESWMPNWHTQGRNPAFVGDGPITTSFGGTKYFWGNTPALDVLNLSKNEGVAFGQDVHVLFAASGDMRNLAMTIARLPIDYQKVFNATLNDLDIDIVARNMIMLLIALTVDNAESATDCMLHVWYSAQLKQSHLQLLESNVYALLQEMCSKISEKPNSTLLAKTWKFGDRTLRVVLTKSAWVSVLSHCSVPAGLTSSRAQKIRTGITLARERVDYLDRHLCMIPPASRVGLMKYRTDGILLPFGDSRSDFVMPNPTFFQNADRWPMPDSADPIEGWADIDVLNTFSGRATKDLYGKLYYHVKNILECFHRRISLLSCNIHMFNVDSRKLPSYVNENCFARIDVSNIVDMAYVGTRSTISLLAPLLQSSQNNAHATLVTLYMNAALEMEQFDPLQESGMHAWMSQIAQYMPIGPALLSPNHPMMFKTLSAKSLFQNGDPLLDLYMKSQNFKEIERQSGTKMKSKNTIIERWPMRLKLKHGQPGAQEEFDAALASRHDAWNCYVEWKRVT